MDHFVSQSGRQAVTRKGLRGAQALAAVLGPAEISSSQVADPPQLVRDAVKVLPAPFPRPALFFPASVPACPPNEVHSSFPIQLPQTPPPQQDGSRCFLADACAKHRHTLAPLTCQCDAAVLLSFSPGGAPRGPPSGFTAQLAGLCTHGVVRNPGLKL